MSHVSNKRLTRIWIPGCAGSLGQFCNVVTTLIDCPTELKVYINKGSVMNNKFMSAVHLLQTFDCIIPELVKEAC